MIGTYYLPFLDISLALAFLLLALTGGQPNKTKNQSMRHGSLVKERPPLMGHKGNVLKRMDAKKVYLNPFEPTRNTKQAMPDTRRNVRKRQDSKNVHSSYLQLIGLRKRKQDKNAMIDESYLFKTNFSIPTKYNVTVKGSQAQQDKKKTFFNNKPEVEYENYLIEKKQMPNVQLSFQDYMRKFDISLVMEKVTSETSNTVKQFMMATELMDPTPDLLKLKIEPINPNPFNLNANRRAWIPPDRRKPGPHIDMFSLRPRIYFLMQQSLYQARDQLIEMQELRSKYREKQIYKMGYIIARSDHLAQLFASDAYKALYKCIKQRETDVSNINLYEYYDFEERLLNHWYELILILELIASNNARLLEVIETNNKTAFKTWFEE